MVNQLLLPFALTIAYVLTASLVVALTLVPAISRFVFRNYVPRQNKWFAKLQGAYGRSLGYFLQHKVIPLGLATVLLFAAIFGVINTGITMIPSMTGDTISATVVLPEDTKKEQAFATADEIMKTATEIEGVKTVAAIDGTTTVSMVSTSAESTGEQVYEMFMFYLLVDDSVTTEEQVLNIANELTERTKDLDCELVTDASSSEAMGSMVGSGLSLTISGPDEKVLQDMSVDIMDIISSVEGYTEIENGLEDADKELHLIIDEDKLTKEGYTVAQLYQDLAAELTESVASSKLTMDGTSMQVDIVADDTKLTRDNILHYYYLQISKADHMSSAF